MRSQIVLAKISLDLDNFPDVFAVCRAMDEPFPKQFPRDQGGITVIKRAR